MLTKLPFFQVNKSDWPWHFKNTCIIYTHKNQLPKVSIVTPSFNQGKFIEETIRSVLLQNYPNLQYIVIDGGSTDSTIEILEKYSPWIDYWISEPDRGQSHAINKGLELCDGQWFNWLNSDDYLMPGAISNMVSAAGKYPQAKVVSGVTENIREGQVFGKYSAMFSPDSSFPFFNLGVNQPGSLLNLDEVKACNGIREDLELCMDLDLWLRILIKNGQDSLISIPEIVATYRYHPQSKTCSVDDVFSLEEFAILTDICQSFSATPIPETLRQLRSHCSASFFNYANKNIDKSNNDEYILKKFFDRLLVNDSLLFKAINKSNEISTSHYSHFKKVLGKLEISSLYGEQQQKIKATALLKAMQNQKKLDISSMWTCLRNLPLVPTLKDVVRILVRG
jgi:glycosyltransferase involved in cell wall biosynthesis